MKLAIADIVSAFHANTIGSKVVDAGAFNKILIAGIEAHDTSQDRQPGQHYIKLPAEACQYVSAGVGKASRNPQDYVLLFHREKVSAYLKRKFAAPVSNVACVVYTLEAYLKDPDATPEESARILAENPTHVLVAVLAAADKPSPLTPFRLVHNLAGGNLEAQQYSADEIRAKAKESLTYHNEWSTVADDPSEDISVFNCLIEAHQELFDQTTVLMSEEISNKDLLADIATNWATDSKRPLTSLFSPTALRHLEVQHKLVSIIIDFEDILSKGK